MSKWSLPDIEIVDVPHDLRGFAHGIMFDVVGYMKGQKPIGPDETFGGLLVSDDQPVAHLASLRLIDRASDPNHHGMLRLVDLNEPAESGFPARLFAAHLICLSETRSYAAHRVELLKSAVQIYPGKVDLRPWTDGAIQDNPGNFVGWMSLGDALCDRGDDEEGIKNLRTATERWPAGAAEMAGNVAKAISAKQLPSPTEDKRSRFWSDIAAMLPR